MWTGGIPGLFLFQSYKYFWSVAAEGADILEGLFRMATVRHSLSALSDLAPRKLEIKATGRKR
jgi:hypothetical protein